MRGLHASPVLAVLITVCLCSTGHAQYDNSGIMVAGFGIVKVRPDRVRIDIQVRGKAEITDDALVKYGDARRRLIEALEKLKLSNLQIKDQAISLSSASQAAYMAMMGGNQGETGQPIEISGSLRIELGDLKEQSREDILKTLGKLLDTIKDAGAGLGPSDTDMMAMRDYGRMPNSTTVKFMVSDFQNLREQAYQQAVEDARVRGNRLANLNGVKLGRVSTVQEVQVSGDASERYNYSPYYWMDQGPTITEKDEIATNTLGDVPVTVRLSVRFQIAEAETAPAAAKTQ